MSFGGLTISLAKPVVNSSTTSTENPIKNVILNQDPDGVELVGENSARNLGDKVHFCTNCNFPIIMYGRLLPCQHAFCWTCANDACRSTQTCLLCAGLIVELEQVDVGSGLLVCAHCLVSFPQEDELRVHVREQHRKPPPSSLHPPPGAPPPPPAPQQGIPPPRPPAGPPPLI
mmetsp:Transcript_17745/g.24532  ORF Transcript_17745/g.24532 Transcript_17745/m.24532 type:complete len:173 (+) Transcript_17745:38-556(+)